MEIEELEVLADSIGKAWAALLGGIVAVVYGADVLVDGAVIFARDMGVSEEVIGLTLIAFGTSLPELAASVVAAYRGHADVALGNVCPAEPLLPADVAENDRRNASAAVLGERTIDEAIKNIQVLADELS